MMIDLGSSSASASAGEKRRKMVRPCDWRDWSGLPMDILFNIMDRLKVIDDYVRFGGVSRSWRSVFLQENPENTNKHCSPPFLLMASEKRQTTTKAVLYSLSTTRVYQKFRFLLSNNKYFRGSSFGWLVTMENKWESHIQVQLQNPFLSPDYIIHLPPLDNLERQHPFFNRLQRNPIGWWDDGQYFHKAVLSSDPSSSQSFTVMAVISGYRGLAFFRSGDTTWTSIGNWQNEPGPFMFLDVIFYNKTRQFYALRENGQVVAVEFQATITQEPKLLQVIPPYPLIERALRAYLVEDLSGELLVVTKHISVHPYNQRSYMLTLYKFDLVEAKWIKTNNLGNSVLFLGTNGSIARALSDCPGCQPNSIYFTEDFNWASSSYKFRASPDQGVYNLEDHTIRPHYNRRSSALHFPASIWIEPTLLPSM